MESGILKWFNVEKGYGFIKAEKGADVFVHVSTVNSANIDPGNFKEGQKVSFDVASNKDGKLSAINLKLIKNNS